MRFEFNYENMSIYDIQLEAIKRLENVKSIEKEMEIELERIKMIGKETEKEIVESVGNIGNNYGGFSMDIRDLFIRYNIPSMKAINSDSIITKDMIRGFVIGGEE